MRGRSPNREARDYLVLAVCTRRIEAQLWTIETWINQQAISCTYRLLPSCLETIQHVHASEMSSNVHSVS